MSGITDFAAQAQALAASLLAASTDPADAVRVLSSLADFTPSEPTLSSGVGDAMATMQEGCGALFRRAAVVALCRASAQYQPASLDDAVSIRTQVCNLLDAEILIAGNTGDDATFNALRVLRAAVVKDLTQRGAKLASLKTISTPSPIPATVLAQRFYRDAGRADELVTESNAVHPAFMPTSFQALSK
ncbi:MAG TPA: hypothetical protein VIQ05_14210 [Tardiphaga sp.]